ncbi:1-deoxy-D-xylulose-5-phosphate reductoisomerase, partial [Streptomonospora algeriensis]
MGDNGCVRIAEQLLADVPAQRRREVVILGSTGSIGTQAIEVVTADPDRFRVVGLAAGGGRPDVLAHQAAALGVEAVAVADEGA